jgi:hypothetical protein
MQNDRGIWMLVMVTVVPCLLCSGMATVVVGPGFGATVLSIILVVYLVIASVGIVTWLATGRGRSLPGSPGGSPIQDDGREQGAPAYRPLD